MQQPRSLDEARRLYPALAMFLLYAPGPPAVALSP